MKGMKEKKIRQQCKPDPSIALMLILRSNANARPSLNLAGTISRLLLLKLKRGSGFLKAAGGFVRLD